MLGLMWRLCLDRGGSRRRRGFFWPRAGRGGGGGVAPLLAGAGQAAFDAHVAAARAAVPVAQVFTGDFAEARNLAERFRYSNAVRAAEENAEIGADAAREAAFVAAVDTALAAAGMAGLIEGLAGASVRERFA